HYMFVDMPRVRPTPTPVPYTTLFRSDQRVVHAVVPHRDAVGDGDGAELQRVPAAGVHTLLRGLREAVQREVAGSDLEGGCARRRDRKSTRLNSSHVSISYAVFCLKKK